MNLFESPVNFLFLGHSEMRWIVMFVSKDERNFVADFLVGETQEADFFIADEVGPSVCRNAGGIEDPTRQNDAQVGGKQTIQTSDGKDMKKIVSTIQESSECQYRHRKRTKELRRYFTLLKHLQLSIIHKLLDDASGVRFLFSNLIK